MRLGPETLGNFELAAQKEWLETNGLGGYASSTVIGANTRHYHGLLVAAVSPPARRFVYLSKLEETVLMQKDRFDLSANQYPGTIHPEGHRYLQEFRLDPYPIFTYSVGGVVLEKSVFMIWGENTTVVTYRLVYSPGGALALWVRPLLSCRDYHAVSYENAFFNTRVEVKEGVLKLKPYDGIPPLYLCHDADQFQPGPVWYRNFQYLREFERGSESTEDLYSPGQVLYLLREGEVGVFIASTEERPVAFVEALRREETDRQRALSLHLPKSIPDWLRPLSKAADSFLVQREGNLSSVIAGYPWFADRARDTLLCLPGLTLATGRFDVARKMLRAYARTSERGLLPSRFSDQGDAPEYHSIDASLWYFYAVGKYLDYTGDIAFVKKDLVAVLLEIMDYYIRGTRHGIRMDRDGLITFSERTLGLTWMDARIKDVPVAPRFGKVVEVNALWYNALRVMERVVGELDQKLQKEYSRLADVVHENFNEVFWDEDMGYCYDWVDETRRDLSFRPNQLLALSLPHPLLPKRKGRRLLEAVARILLTPVGLRTLSPDDKNYQPIYKGDQPSRDRAMYQGAVWPWLVGPYISAMVKVYGRTRKVLEDSEKILKEVTSHTQDVALGTLPELFGGELPHAPGGCVSYAASLAEILRVWTEDIEAVLPRPGVDLLEKKLSKKG